MAALLGSSSIRGAHRPRPHVAVLSLETLLSRLSGVNIVRDHFLARHLSGLQFTVQVFFDDLELLQDLLRILVVSYFREREAFCKIPLRIDLHFVQLGRIDFICQLFFQQNGLIQMLLVERVSELVELVRILLVSFLNLLCGRLGFLLVGDRLLF